MQTLTIESKGSKKSRSFSVLLLAHIEADRLWSRGQAGDIRPVWMVIAASHNQMQAFVANLKLGKKSILAEYGRSPSRSPSKIEILKTGGYHFSKQRMSQGTAVTVYLPDLFRVDPGMVDPEGVHFVVLPAQSWLREDPTAVVHLHQVMDLLPKSRLEPTEPDLEWIAGVAPLFINYLDRRTRCPIIPDPRFHAQVLYAALDIGLASRSTERWSEKWGEHHQLRYNEVGLEGLGYARGLGFEATHEVLEKFLSEQVQVYYEIIKHG